MTPLRTKVYLLSLIFAVLAFLWSPAFAQSQEFKTYKNDTYGFSIDYPGTWKSVKSKPVYTVVFQASEGSDSFPHRVNVACQKPYQDGIASEVERVKEQIKKLKQERDRASNRVKIVMDGKFDCVPGAYFLQLEAYDPELKADIDIVLVYYLHNDLLLRVSCLTKMGSLDRMFGLFNRVLCSVKFHQPAPPAPITTAPTPAPTPSPGPPEEQEQPPAPMQRQPRYQDAPPPLPQPRYPAPALRTPAPAPAQQEPLPPRQEAPQRMQAPAPAPPAEPDDDAGPAVTPQRPPVPGTRGPAPAPRPSVQPEEDAPSAEAPSAAPRPVQRGPRPTRPGIVE
ncbi:MAG: hypothetical protein AB1646_00255 [Thermodesulfobacteriota bacterium]